MVKKEEGKYQEREGGWPSQKIDFEPEREEAGWKKRERERVDWCGCVPKAIRKWGSDILLECDRHTEQEIQPLGLSFPSVEEISTTT